ncbi:hypothetical protein IAT40_006108 [Kwoniella sp. CBS 6097]
MAHLNMSNSTSSSPRSRPVRPSNVEYDGYYYGLPSEPRLLARSQVEEWVPASNPVYTAYPSRKHIYPVPVSHPVARIWTGPAGRAILAEIDKHTPFATSVDVLRICYEGEADSSPPILWIGVLPGKVSVLAAEALVSGCKGVLQRNGMIDVEVELKESNVYRTSSAKLYDPFKIESQSIGVEIKAKISTAIGLAICTDQRPYKEGSTAFWLVERGDPNKHLLMTAAHVVGGTELDEPYGSNVPHPSQRQFGFIPPNVQIGKLWLDKRVQTIEELSEGLQNELGDVDFTITACGNQKKIELAEARKVVAEARLDDLRKLEAEVVKWRDGSSGRLGEVYCRPLIRNQVGHDNFTEDWATIEVDPALLPDNVQNSLDLSSFPDFKMANGPDHKPALGLKKPGILKLQGIIPRDEMESGPICVLMRGSRSGLSVGLSLPIASMIKPYDECNKTIPKDMPDEQRPWSVEWPITALPENGTSAVFSREGDSGAGIVGRDGRMGGIMTGGCRRGPAERLGMDVTYVTPMYWILERMKVHGLVDPELV